jgi:flagellar motor switch protein FliN/FliY
MSKLSPDTIEKFAAIQDSIWQNVSTCVASTTEQEFTFSFEAPEAVPPETARALAGEPALSIQFAFATAPENLQLVSIPRDAFASMSSFIKGMEVGEPDETLIPDLREFLEAMVQGICLACGMARNEPMVASGLTIRYQPVVLPDNFGRNDDLAKVEVRFSATDVSASFSWFLDNRSVLQFLASEAELEAENTSLPGAQNPESLPQPAANAEDVGGLSLLLDIPLEIRVELGRVKMLVKDVVDLGTGSIVEIDKAAGEPVDVMVNGRLVARGEVVVIEDNFGVRITEILTAPERIARLGDAA